MNKWVNTKVGMPNSEIACVVLRRSMDALSVYPKFVEWDGKDWIDIDGEVIPGVIAWTKAPDYDQTAEKLLRKLAGCYEKDSCEQRDCCYFARSNELYSLLEYIEM